MELKESAQRFWVIGFLISLIIHSAVLGAFHLTWFDGSIDMSKIHFTLRPWARAFTLR